MLNFILFLQTILKTACLSQRNQADKWEFTNEVFSEHFSVGLERSAAI